MNLSKWIPFKFRRKSAEERQPQQIPVTHGPPVPAVPALAHPYLEPVSMMRELHAAPIVTSLEDLRDVRHITELHGQEALG